MPFSQEAEESVIGAVISDDSVLGDVIQMLHAEHFYIEVYRGIYEILSSMFMASDKIDIVTVKEACMRHGVFKTDGDANVCLVNAVNRVPSISGATVYANIIVEKYILRSLLLASHKIIETINSDQPADKIVDFAEQQIYDIRAGIENRSLTPISGIAYGQLMALQELAEQSARNGGKPVMTGLSTGYTELDRRIFGLNKTDLIILAARPGMGKTSFAMNIAVNAAKLHRDKAVCIFSLEMSKEQLVSRMICSEGQVSSDVMKTGRVPINDWEKITTATAILTQLNIMIDDTPACNIMGIKSKLRRVNNLGLVIIDYLQLMTSSNNYNGNRVAEISEITRNLKIMAKELNVPVIALSQLARGTEQREDKRPLLSDLRDSGSIEQDADIVMFLYRNSYYQKDDPNQNLCECIVAKNRHGEVGTAYLGWFSEYTKFMNIDYKVKGA